MMFHYFTPYKFYKLKFILAYKIKSKYKTLAIYVYTCYNNTCRNTTNNYQARLDTG